MSDPTVSDLLARYYEASTVTEQERIIGAIGRIAGDVGQPSSAWVPGVQALIELLHLVRNPRERVRVIRGFAHCHDRAFAVPPLLGELDESDADVVEAALWSIGRIGVHFGGSAIVNWLDGCDLDTLPEAVLHRALLALAEIGSPEAPERAEACWERGQIPPRIAHLVMAESVSSRMVEHARTHLDDPATASAAALHLAMVAHEGIDALLAEQMREAGTEMSLLMHQLLEPRRGRKGGSAEATDLLLDAVALRHPIRRRRLARRLRARPVTEVLGALVEVAGLTSGSDTMALVTAAMNAGIPALQDAVLDLYSEAPQVLAWALRQVHSPTPRLLERLETWVRHPDTWVAINAVRAYSNVCGPEGLSYIEDLAQSDRDKVRIEWVRAQQNAWMLQRNTRGRIPVEHAQRQALVQQIGRILRQSPPPPEQELALYLVGNLDLNELADRLPEAIESCEDPRLRRAAANSMGELELERLVPLYPGLIEHEADEDVRFHLLRATLRDLSQGSAPPSDLAAVLRRQLAEGLLPRLCAPTLALLGLCEDTDSIDLLSKHARSDAQLFAGIAITALGRIGHPRCMDAVLSASRHGDLERRVRAARALGGIGGEVAQDRLLSMIEDESEIDARRTALAALQASGPSSELLGQLNAQGPEDPLALEILHLQLEVARSLGRMDTDQIDAQLAAAIPGFDPARIARVSDDALETFRAAEFLSSLQQDLPAGLDASAPVLLWNKGLEVWLNAMLRTRILAFIDQGGLELLPRIEHDWWNLKHSLAPAWNDDLLGPGMRDTWGGLARGLCKSVRFRTDVTRRSLSLGNIATFLLICGQPGAGTGKTWELGMKTEQLRWLANALVVLSRKRNRLTHQEAGELEMSQKVRELACGCVGVLG